MLFIDKTIIDCIVKCTEAEARNKLSDETWKTSNEEIYKLIGVMIARGLLVKGLSTDETWSTTWGPPFFRQALSRGRYKELISFIRFDMRSTRSERLHTEKFALVLYVWNHFIENCKSHYNPHEDITIDEQLFPTKARYPFTQYIASKPDKFGIKFWLAADVQSKYCLNGFPYLGKDDHRPSDQTLSEHVVLKLMEPFLGGGHNVTTDNFFTSVKLGQKLANKKTSIVGTVNHIRREVPPQIKSCKKPLYSSTILKSNNMTLTVYQSKPSKNVLVLSTVHRSVAIAEGKKKLPETIVYYNATKYGVDVLDQMARLYTSKVSSRRWPLQVFYNVFDLAGINSWIVYKEATGLKISRRAFLLQLVTELQLRDDIGGNSSSHDDSTNEEEVVEAPKVRQ